LTDVELQTCGARQTEQESKLSAFFAKMEEFFASPSSPSLQNCLVQHVYFAKKGGGGEERRRQSVGRWLCLPHLGGGDVSTNKANWR
jgi:hypothetical protein